MRNMIEINVGEKEEYNTIQSAIDSLGDVIFEDVKIIVEPGEYKEYVKIRTKEDARLQLRVLKAKLKIQM